MQQRLFALQEEVFKTLANQKRLEVVQLLTKRELTVTEMVGMLGIPQANLSQHLSVLRHVKVVSTRKQGLRVYYRLTDEHIGAVVKAMRDFLKIQYAHEAEISKIVSQSNSPLYPIVRDVVCGMRFNIHEAGDSVVLGDREYYFCAQGCKETFTADHNKYSHTLSRDKV